MFAYLGPVRENDGVREDKRWIEIGGEETNRQGDS